MSENTDQTLGDQPPADVKMPQLATAAVENFLTLDKVMESARLVERDCIICLRGDLEAEHQTLLAELATLVDAEGNVVADDESLADQKVARARELQDLIQANEDARRAESYKVRFQAMPSDEWEAFEIEHREDRGAGEVKSFADYQRKLIARCSLNPKFSEDDVVALRKKLGAPQINRMFNTAFAACTSGGLDVPKSPSFSVGQKPQGSSRS